MFSYFPSDKAAEEAVAEHEPRRPAGGEQDHQGDGQGGREEDGRAHKAVHGARHGQQQRQGGLGIAV